MQHYMYLCLHLLDKFAVFGVRPALTQILTMNVPDWTGLKYNDDEQLRGRGPQRVENTARFEEKLALTTLNVAFRRDYHPPAPSFRTSTRAL